MEDGKEEKACRYCGAVAKCSVRWFRGKFGGPGVTVPWCGECSLKNALATRGMSAPVHEGEDYEVIRPRS